MSYLVIGLIIFLGAHSLRIVAGDWRDAQCARLGEMRWKGVFSLVSALGLALIIWGYGLAHVDSPVLWLAPRGIRHLAALLTLPAFIVNQKVKTTGFSRSALAAKICCARGGAAWTTDMAAIRYFKSSTTLFG